MRSWEVIPGVIRNDGVDSFRLEIDTNGPVKRVTLRNVTLHLVAPGPEPIELHDDGVSPDRVAASAASSRVCRRWFA